MANTLRALTLSNAGWLESARSGHETVDVDHLFLGLLASGGPAARLLGRHGITLPSARRAMRRRRRIAEGRPVDDDATSTSIPVGDLHYEVVGDLPWTQRASRLGPSPTARHTDLSLLLALLDDDSGIVREILESEDVDPAQLRAEAVREKENDTDPGPQNGEDPGEFLPGDATTSTVTIEHYLAEPLGSVWESVRDPALVVLWAGTPETSRVVSGGVETTFEKFGQRGYVRLDPVLVEEPTADAARLVWLERHFSDRVDGEPGGYYDIQLAREGEGTLLTLVRGIRTFGTFGRALLPIARRTTAASLGTTVQDIAYASARAGA